MSLLSFVKARPPKRLSDKVLRCDGETPRGALPRRICRRIHDLMSEFKL